MITAGTGLRRLGLVEAGKQRPYLIALATLSVAAGLTEAPEQAQNEIAYLQPLLPPSQSQQAGILHQPPEKSMEDKIILAVPYAEKEQAKAAAKSWFQAAMGWRKQSMDCASQAEIVRGWNAGKLTGPMLLNPPGQKRPKAQFMHKRSGCRVLNIDAAKMVKSPVDDGQIYRVPTDDDKAGAR